MKKNYSPYYSSDQIICGEGEAVIVTGWTPKEAIAKKLSPEQYAAIGNLYSPMRGLSPLMRNLICNPHIRNLVILNCTRQDRIAGSSQCLIDFFKHGIKDNGDERWIVKSDVKGYIEGVLPHNILNQIREYYFIYIVDDVNDVSDIVEELNNEIPLRPIWQKTALYDSPFYYPDSKENTIGNRPSKVLPGPLYGHRIEGETVAETWIKILQRIRSTGKVRPTGYGGNWQELINLTAVVTDEPEDFFFPEPNYLPVDREFLGQYIPQMVDDAPYEEGVKYSYGQRLRSWFGKDQVEQVINKLIGEIDAASAVMSLWDVEDHIKGGSPCLNHIWARVIDDRLSLTAVLRSNDMFGAWCANAMGLIALQKHLIEEINKRSEYDLVRGPLITLSQSAHIYQDCWGYADSTVLTEYLKLSQRRNYADPCGYFTIEVNSGEIHVKQIDGIGGEIVCEYKGTKPLELVREIAKASPAILPDHIGYLGIELQRAGDCLKGAPPSGSLRDRVYIQDKD
jgi:thymidylate synthase